MYRPPLNPGNVPGTHFCQMLSRPQDHSAFGRILCQWKIQWHQLGSNQRTSDLCHSTLTTVPPRSSTEMSTGSISWGGKGGRYVRLATQPPSCAVVRESGEPNFLETSGTLQACNGAALPLPLLLEKITHSQPSNFHTLIISVHSFTSPVITLK